MHILMRRIYRARTWHDTNRSAGCTCTLYRVLYLPYTSSILHITSCYYMSFCLLVSRDDAFHNHPILMENRMVFGIEHMHIAQQTQTARTCSRTNTYLACINHILKVACAMHDMHQTTTTPALAQAHPAMQRLLFVRCIAALLFRFIEFLIAFLACASSPFSHGAFVVAVPFPLAEQQNCIHRVCCCHRFRKTHR